MINPYFKDTNELMFRMARYTQRVAEMQCEELFEEWRTVQAAKPSAAHGAADGETADLFQKELRLEAALVHSCGIMWHEQYDAWLKAKADTQ